MCLTGCLGYSASEVSLYSPLPEWQYADLRLVDAADSLQPSQDVIALYTRIVDQEAQIRLDYMDYPQQVDHDLLVYIRMHQGTYQQSGDALPNWDYQIMIPAEGQPRLVNSAMEDVSGVMLRVERDTVLDAVVITFSAVQLKPYLPRADVWITLTEPGLDEALDKLAPVAWQAAPPPRLPVVVGFWNTFAAATPAQALRRWDGAHSGPNSARHGLRNLLTAVERTHSPIILFDLKTPANLSSLDHMGVLSQVTALSKQGLLLLPDILPLGAPSSPRLVIPDWVHEKILNDSKSKTIDFGLSTSPFLFTGLWQRNIPAQGLEFVFPRDLGWGFGCGWYGEGENCRGLLVGYGYAHYSNLSDQITPTGLTEAVRRKLVDQAAIGAQEVFFLGGDLNQTSWGEPTAAFQALDYISRHPWLELISPYELPARHAENSLPGIEEIALDPLPIFAPSGERLKNGLNSAELHENVVKALSTTGPGVFRDLAWQMYEMLLAPGSDALYDLKLAYLGQIGHLLAAGRWSQDPEAEVDCTQDLDWDGLPECTLSSEYFFAAFESEGGGITVAAARTEAGITQVLAPTYQFAVGSSDPSTWDLSRGIAGDPAQLFAFTEEPTRWAVFEAQATGDRITFSLDGIAIKTYSLVPGGLQIDFHDTSFHSIAIPVVIDPGSRFEPGWSAGFASSASSQSWSWSKEGKIAIVIESKGQITPSLFYESKDLLSQPEDPNYAYPAGHYTPFPMALIRIESPGAVQIELKITDW